MKKNTTAIPLLGVVFLIICIQPIGTGEEWIRSVSAGGSIGPAGFPSWSPDGNYIAFVTEQEDGRKDIWVMENDGQNPIKLTEDFDRVDPFFSWSPDSSQIVLGGRSSGDPKNNIWLINRDGTEPFNLSAQITMEGYLWHMSPAWSPDGRYVAFESATEERTDIIVIEMEAFTSDNVTEEIGTVNDQFSWSPDSQHIVVRTQTLISAETQTWAQPEIFVVNVDGTSPTKITHSLQKAMDEILGRVSALQFIHEGMAWSPTGEFIAFSVQYLTGADIFLIDSTGSDIVDLTQASPLDDLFPVWSPDGSSIAFVGFYRGKSDIWVMGVDEFYVKNLTYSGRTRNLQPDWSPTGDKIVFQSDQAGEFDIWVMDTDGSNPVNLTAD